MAAFLELHVPLCFLVVLRVPKLVPNCRTSLTKRKKGNDRLILAIDHIKKLNDAQESGKKHRKKGVRVYHSKSTTKGGQSLPQ